MADPVDILELQDERLAYSWIEFTLWPRMWDSYTEPMPLSWFCRRLDEAERSHIPTEPGVYTLLIQPGLADHPHCSYLIYVGKAESLRERFHDYLTKERRNPRRRHMHRALNKYPNHLWFCFAEVPSASLREIESALIVAYAVPFLNREIPSELRPVERAFK